jgi:hypothetical protein
MKSGPSVEGDTWQRSNKLSGYRHLGFGVDRGFCHQGIGNSESRHWIGTIHQEGRVAAIERHQEKPDREVVHRLIGNRDIGDPGDKGFVHFEIAIHETPMSGG